METQLRQLSAPWFHHFIGSHSELTNFCWSIANRNVDLSIRIVRGSRMRTVSALFDEFSAAFQFPYYFGENWSAFDECLADLEWLPATGYVMAISDTTKVLSDEGFQEFATFISVLTEVAEHWSVPVEQGETWDRPG